MKLSEIFKRSKPHIKSENISAAAVAKASHKKRIDNLNQELSQIKNEIESNELDFIAIKAEREKKSNDLIRRMTLIRYEIDIREGVIQWLS